MSTPTPTHKPSPFPWRGDGCAILDAYGDIVTVTCEEITVSDFDRILTCVNAMAEIQDPAAFMRDARHALLRLQHYPEWHLHHENISLEKNDKAHVQKAISHFIKA